MSSAYHRRMPRHDIASQGAPGETGNQYRGRRAELRARLAAERADLLCSLLGVEAEALEERPLIGEAPAVSLLSTLAAQDHSFARSIEDSLGNQPPDPADDAGARTQEAGFEFALVNCVAARSRFLDAFARVPDDVVFGRKEAPGGATAPLTMATQCYWNDSSLSLRASAWTRQEGLGEGVGPASLLRAAARAARKELLTTVALVPIGARGVSAFEGGRTLPEIFRTVAGLESMFLRALDRAGHETPPAARTPKARSNDEWQQAWANLHATHTAVLGMLDGLDTTAFGHDITDGAGNLESVYMWARGCLLHDRLHAAHIRADLELDWPERLLR
jgi:hypothetical protein